MNATTEIVLRKSYSKKDGTHPIYLRVIINRKSKYHSLQVYCKEEDWLTKKQRVSTTIKNSAAINLKIADAETRSNSIINNFTRFNTPPTFTEFFKKFKGNFSTNNFYSLAENYIHDNATLSSESKRTYKSQLTKLNNFRNIKTLTLAEVNNLDFLVEYQKYMIKVLNNHNNTVTKSLSFIRTILHYAIKNDLLESNAVNKMKLKKIPSKREFLTIEEIETLENYYNSKCIPKGEKNVLQYFLFSCHTGLRYLDIKHLTKNQIVNTGIKSKSNGRNWQTIEFPVHKTKTNVVIPLTDKALKYIPDNIKDNAPLFRVISNQKTNNILRKSITKCNIEKSSNISFHCARHSFATNTLHKGVDIKIVSKMLGHQRLQTTEVYTHMDKKYYCHVMEAFNL
ncbi:MAG: site-specific integrase [Marinilabiliaceae bacterium]|nr:site-specific integrase [Marinilabiliaceae bacterium]